MRKASYAIAVAIALLAVLASPAWADVVILKGNDVPITGRILPTPEDSKFMKFQIKGLGETSTILIDKSRIKRFWREENTNWEYAKAEEERKKKLEELRAKGELEPAPEIAVDPEPVAATPPPSSPAPSSGRTGTEVRRDIFARGLERARALIPGSPILWVLAMAGIFGLVALILFLGSRVAELPRLGWGKSVFLAVVTQVFVALPILAAPHMTKPGVLPLLVSCEVVAWVLFSRLLAGGAVAKSILLLSFFLASACLVGGGFFSLIVAI